MGSSLYPATGLYTPWPLSQARCKLPGGSEQWESPFILCLSVQEWKPSANQLVAQVSTAEPPMTVVTWLGRRSQQMFGNVLLLQDLLSLVASSREVRPVNVSTWEIVTQLSREFSVQPFKTNHCQVCARLNTSKVLSSCCYTTFKYHNYLNIVVQTPVSLSFIISESRPLGMLSKA